MRVAPHSRRRWFEGGGVADAEDAGRLFTWGFGKYGQLGHGGAEVRFDLILIDLTLTDVDRMSLSLVWLKN
jgi:hypothetical protein